MEHGTNLPSTRGGPWPVYENPKHLFVGLRVQCRSLMRCDRRSARSQGTDVLSTHFLQVRDVHVDMQVFGSRASFWVKF